MADKLRLIRSAQAERDMARIYDYTVSRWGKEQAARYLRELDAAEQRLCESPALGHIRPDVPPPYFGYPSGKHCIIFRLDAVSVRVLRILHQAMDFTKQLDGPFEDPS